MLPQIPAWNAIHPLIVHFPIVLTLIAPMFVLAAMMFRKHARIFAVCALALMAGGAVGAILSVSSGEAGSEQAEQIPGAEPMLERHEELAETTQTLLVVVTFVYAAIVIAPMYFKKLLSPAPSIALNVMFLLLYLFVVVALVNTAHLGGILVHKYGAHASVNVDIQPQGDVESGEGDEDEDE